MTFLECFLLFVAIVSTVNTISSYINVFISIAAIKDNFVDRHWLGRFINLVISAISIVSLVYLWQ